MTDAGGRFADFFGRLWRQKPMGIASGIVILTLILVAIFADVLAPYPFDQLNLAEPRSLSQSDGLLGPQARSETRCRARQCRRIHRWRALGRAPSRRSAWCPVGAGMGHWPVDCGMIERRSRRLRRR